MSLLRVHSSDLHEHVASETSDCLQTGLFTDLTIRCAEGHEIQAHKLVLAGVSPYIKKLLINLDEKEAACLHLPDIQKDQLKSLMEIVYTGSIEATVDEMRQLLTLAHSLHINVPVSDQLMKMLDLQPKDFPKAQEVKTEPVSNPEQTTEHQSLPNFGLQMNSGLMQGGLSVLQQQILSQYVLMNGLLGTKKTENQEISCPVCGVQVADQMALRQHMLGHKISDSQDYQADMKTMIQRSFNMMTASYVCPVCQSSYTNKGNFRQHAEKHFKSGQLGPSTGDSVPALYKCNECQSTFSHPGNYKQHMMKHEKDQRNITGLANREPSHLNSVLQSAFADRVDNGDPCKSYFCHQCDRSFKHPGNFKQHMASHNKQILTPNKRPMPGLVKMVSECPECGYRAESDIDLHNHMKTIHDIEMVLPTQQHKRMKISDDRTVSPSICDQQEDLSMTAGFSSQDDTVFPCPQCDKQFDKITKLTQHLKTHTPEVHYRYPCDICGKKFTRPQHVTRHKLLHTGEKPFTCDKCDKSFAREDKLKHHLLKGCVQLDHSIDSKDGEDIENEINNDDEEVKDEKNEENIEQITSNPLVGVMG